MLAARVTIEDGLCLLLDVDDIDRFLQFNQLQDGGIQLKRRRQALLEGLATSLQLVDPLGNNGHTLVPVLQQWYVPRATPASPLGSPAGDGASLILNSVLERATELLTDPHAASNYNVTNRALWQASFDEFFGLLTKYCVNKYDSIMQSRLMEASPNVPVIGADTAISFSREMPVELLRASLPHTDEHQRQMLLDFTQRSMPIGASNSRDGGNGTHMNSESVLS
ncbi:protein PAT1 homolog 1 [Prunus yedoensis var. nudiflora]|uniref:Protein PAT1 homolog 1 n=1 Tax=Prunus yedoensis var. nudiflora TaxID=2094558 RepID=A0A314UX37_PRUYE|nr:protein PAT1 homolog 1 [Prunus yedoensis var. nudiflora]